MRATILRLPVGVLWCAFAAQVLGAGNPIMPGADPHAVVLNGTVWVYPTWSDHWRSARFFAFSSINLVNWQRHGPVLDFKDVPWIRADGAEVHYAWAPALLTADSRYYFYYLSYSHGGWREASYSVHYATADSPTGPWQYRGPILVSEGSRKGPGHHSFIRNPLTGEWIIVYHRWENQTDDGPYRGSRQLCIDRIEYDAEGLIRPIVMTGMSAEPRTGEFTGATNALGDMRIRDPFVLPDRSTGLYYLVASSGATITVRLYSPITPIPRPRKWRSTGRSGWNRASRTWFTATSGSKSVTGQSRSLG